MPSGMMTTGREASNVRYKTVIKTCAVCLIHRVDAEEQIHKKQKAGNIDCLVMIWSPCDGSLTTLRYETLNQIDTKQKRDGRTLSQVVWVCYVEYE